MSFSTIEIKDENELFWGGDEPQTPPPVVRAQLIAPGAPAREKRRDPLQPLDANVLDEILVAWSDRSHQNRMAVLNAEADNLLMDILGHGRKERVMDALADTIATAKRNIELKVPLWSYKTVEYGRDIEGTSWADKPYDGFTSSRDWARCYGYETYITASRYSVDYIFKHTDAMKRLAEAFSDEYFRVVKHKTLDWDDGEVCCYTVSLWLEFWPSKTIEARLREAYVATEPVDTYDGYVDDWCGDCGCCDDEY
jgi:hypothetical protein